MREAGPLAGVARWGGRRHSQVPGAGLSRRHVSSTVAGCLVACQGRPRSAFVPRPKGQRADLFSMKGSRRSAIWSKQKPRMVNLHERRRRLCSPGRSEEKGLAGSGVEQLLCVYGVDLPCVTLVRVRLLLSKAEPARSFSVLQVSRTCIHTVSWKQGLGCFTCSRLGLGLLRQD